MGADSGPAIPQLSHRVLVALAHGGPHTACLQVLVQFAAPSTAWLGLLLRGLQVQEELLEPLGCHGGWPPVQFRSAVATGQARKEAKPRQREELGAGGLLHSPGLGHWRLWGGPEITAQCPRPSVACS